MNKKLYSTSLILGSIFVFAGVSLVFAANNSLHFSHAVPEEYSLTLSSSDAYTSGTTKRNPTANGYEVGFSYFNCDSYSNKHALINNGGTIGNNEIIHSINGFRANFTGPLQVRYSLNQVVWTDYVDVTSGTTYVVENNPYYFQVRANGNSVTLDSLTVNFSCEINENEGQGTGGGNYTKVTSDSELTTGDYLIVYESNSNAYVFNGALSTMEATSNYVSATIENNTIAASGALEAAVFTIDTSNKTICNQSGVYIGSTTNANKLVESESAIAHTELSVDVEDGFYAQCSPGTVLRFNSASDQNRFRYYKSSSYYNQQPVWLYKKGGGSAGPAVKVVGITATENSLGLFDETHSFNEISDLVVKTVDENGTQKEVPNGQYSIALYNSNNVAINPAQPFGSAGNYKLVISYSTFTPVVINITVGQVNQITGITAHMAKTVFTTGETLNLSTNLTADIMYKYSEDDVSNLAYNNFSRKGLEVKLLNSSNAEVNINNALTVAGTYTLKVYSSVNSSVNSSVSITVNAINVTSVSLNKTTLNLSIGDSETLTATVLPTNATNKDVTWSTSSSGIATVSNGTVRAISKGTATITVRTADGGLTATCTVNVSEIAVTGITLDQTSATVNVGKTITLTPTITPSNATNKNITWTSSSTSVATVSNGVVTGVAAGTATITAKTESGNKTATCNVTVSEAPAPSGELVIAVEDIPSSYSTSGSVTVDEYNFTAYNVANGYTSGAMQWKATSGYIQNNTAITGLQSITIDSASGKSFSGNLYSGTTAGATTHSQSVSNGGTYTIPSGDSFFKIFKESSGAGYTGNITISYSSTPVNPTGITLSDASISLARGKTKALTVNYQPSNCNTNKGVSWTSNNTSVATVSQEGIVTVADNATIGASATITATSTYNSSFKATCLVTVSEEQRDEWTIMIYMCGADLESESGLATGDIKEILSVANQPDDVNIIIETGGAKKWDSTYGISASYLTRWHVENKRLVKDAQLSKVSMGKTSTFQSFLEWGLTEYPANKTGVILWNHGGAMYGVCYDENASDDSLLNSEVKSAVNGAMTNVGRTDKLEFIGYDACLMQVQDIAEFNSQNFNYMIGSEESESGYGWDYDTWVDDLYAKKSTDTILKACINGFIAENGGTSSSSNDQTLSYLNLSYVSAYKTAWENMATALKSKVTSSNKTSFINLVKTAKHYAEDDYDYFMIFDALDLTNKIAGNSTFNPGSSYTNAVKTAHGNLVVYSSCGRGAGNSNGLAVPFPWSSANKSYYNQAYNSTESNFTNWLSFCRTAGYLS